MKRIFWFLFALFSILIGLYPLGYLFIDKNVGLLSTKPTEILTNHFWNLGFYGHISFGGLALLIGWLQFSKKLRTRNILLHRKVGYVYMISVLLSGICGLYIATYATGGLISRGGFLTLGFVWLISTYQAYRSIRTGNIEAHQNYMIYSYAACFGAVTLRIWLPILIVIFGNFHDAYKVVAWLSWVPNILIAYFIIGKNKIQRGKQIFRNNR